MRGGRGGGDKNWADVGRDRVWLKTLRRPNGDLRFTDRPRPRALMTSFFLSFFLINTGSIKALPSCISLLLQMRTTRVPEPGSRAGGRDTGGPTHKLYPITEQFSAAVLCGISLPISTVAIRQTFIFMFPRNAWRKECKDKRSQVVAYRAGVLFQSH